jgi:hypothetical protein
MADDNQDITRSLAIAFDRVWESYYRAGRVTISQAVARSELARRLVQLSRQGVRDEATLTRVGLRYLRELPHRVPASDEGSQRLSASDIRGRPDLYDRLPPLKGPRQPNP